MSTDRIWWNIRSLYTYILSTIIPICGGREPGAMYERVVVDGGVVVGGGVAVGGWECFSLSSADIFLLFTPS